LNAELVIGRTSAQFQNAIRKFKNDFGDTAFEIASAETWVEYLSAEGYPTAVTDRQHLARSMIDWGLDPGAANFMVLTIRDQKLAERLIDALHELSGSMAVVRDNNYLSGIQGIQDTEGYLADLESNLERFGAEIRTIRSDLEATRREARSSEVRLREAKRQFAALSCS
jgi:hypothetical protein